LTRVFLWGGVWWCSYSGSALTINYSFLSSLIFSLLSPRYSWLTFFKIVKWLINFFLRQVEYLLFRLLFLTTIIIWFYKIDTR
jgi:hypothetical protein